MQCTKCGSMLAPGEGFCTNCGTPVVKPNAGPSQPSYDPTVLAPQPGSNPGYNPTMQASSPGYGTPPPLPPTNYGAPPPANPYESPQANPYAAPPPPLPNAPYAPVPGPYVVPPKKSNKTLWIVLSVVLGVVVLACASCGGYLYVIGKNASNTLQNTQATAQALGTSTANQPTAVVPNDGLGSATATPTSNSSAPTSNDIDPAAKAVITDIQIAAAVNDTTLDVTKPAPPAFNSGQPIVVVFHIPSGGSGYYTTKWYVNGQLEHDGKIYNIDPKYDKYSITFPISTTGQGVVGVYWCTQSDCSDAKLAQVGTFNVQ